MGMKWLSRDSQRSDLYFPRLRKSLSFFEFEMKEYLKLSLKEEELSLELSKNLFISLKDYKRDKRKYLNEELKELQDIINSNDINLLKTKIHEFECQLSQYKQELCQKLGDLALQEANFTQQLEKLHLIIQNHEIIDLNYSSFIPVARKETIVKEEEEYLDFLICKS